MFLNEKNKKTVDGSFDLVYFIQDDYSVKSELILWALICPTLCSSSCNSILLTRKRKLRAKRFQYAVALIYYSPSIVLTFKMTVHKSAFTVHLQYIP